MSTCCGRLFQLLGNSTLEEHSVMTAEAFSFAKKGLAKAVRSVAADSPLDEFPPVCPDLTRSFRLSIKLPDYDDVKNALDVHNSNSKAKLHAIRFTIRNDVEEKRPILYADFHPATRGFTVKAAHGNEEELMQVVLPNNSQAGAGIGKLVHPAAGISLFKMVKAPAGQNDKYLVQRTGGSNPGTFLEVTGKPRLELQAEKLSQLNFDDKEYKVTTCGSEIIRIGRIWPKLAPSSRTYVLEMTPGNYGYQTRVVMVAIGLLLTLHIAYPELLQLISNETNES